MCVLVSLVPHPATDTHVLNVVPVSFTLRSILSQEYLVYLFVLCKHRKFKLRSQAK